MFPNGQQRLVSHDDQGRITQVANVHPTAGNLATYAYGYDTNSLTGEAGSLGEITSQIADVPFQGLSAALTKYFYDSSEQLARVDYPDAEPFDAESDSWAYDALGNRIASVVNGQSQSHDYQKVGANPANWQRLLNDGSNSYSYDQNGSTISKVGPGGSFSFAWDSDNRLSAVSGAAAATYSYDYEGRRRSSSGNEALVYVYDGNHLIEEASQSSKTDYLFGPELDELLAVSKEGVVYYFDVDARGSVSLINGSNGGVVQSRLFDAWGVVRAESGSFGSRFGFAGREHAEAGLQYLRARYLSPEAGRFSSEDPLYRTIIPPYSLGANPPNVYVYVGNSPIDQTDPLGLDGILICSRRSGLAGIGNHAYFWNPRPDAKPRYCGKGGAQERGPIADACVSIPGSDGREDDLMTCCESQSSSSPFMPGMWDCHETLAMCQVLHLPVGVDPQSAPGGRFGPRK